MIGRPFRSSIAEGTWDAFLVHLAELGSPARVEKIAGMPSRKAFNTKLKRDPAFAARAAGLWKHKWLRQNIWYTFVAQMAEARSPFKLCDRPGMPSKKAWYAKMRADPLFASRVNALWSKREKTDDIWDAVLDSFKQYNQVEACARFGVCVTTLRKNDALIRSSMRA